jgi:hypothetical protein
MWGARRVGARAHRTLVTFGLMAVGPALGAALVMVEMSSRAEIVALAIVVALGAALLVGLLLRTSRPVLSTVLMVVGAAAPAIAWRDPFGYLNAVVVAVAAIGSARYRASDRSFALATADGAPVRGAVRGIAQFSPAPVLGYVDLHCGRPASPYRPIGPVEAVCRKNGYSKPLELSDVNDRLAAAARRLGANAVIDVRYQRGPGLIAWDELKAFGTAVVVSADTDVAG